jgi:hypothetical protein
MGDYVFIYIYILSFSPARPTSFRVFAQVAALSSKLCHLLNKNIILSIIITEKGGNEMKVWQG